MIDPVATYNYISVSEMEELGMSVSDYGGFGMALGNDESIRGKGLCRVAVEGCCGG